jgi:hypothetical protein
MSPIYVFSPNVLRNKDTGEYYTKYTACVNTQLGPFGFGDTPKEAVQLLKVELHRMMGEHIDALPAYFCDKNGLVKESIEL